MQEDTPKKSIGRPSKYKEEFCQMLIEHLNTGYTFESFAGVANVCCDTLYEWLKVHEKFSEAKKIGNEKARLFWEKQGIDGLWANKEFNSTVYVFMMKNRYGYRSETKEKEEVKQKPSFKIVLDNDE